MLQAAVGDGLALDPLAAEKDGFAALKADLSRGEVAEALVIPAVSVLLDEGCDLTFELAEHVVVFQQDAVLSVWCQRSILPRAYLFLACERLSGYVTGQIIEVNGGTAMP